MKTVSTYRARILEKMNLGSNADMTYYAIKNGLIQKWRWALVRRLRAKAVARQSRRFALGRSRG